MIFGSENWYVNAKNWNFNYENFYLDSKIVNWISKLILGFWKFYYLNLEIDILIMKKYIFFDYSIFWFN
jgi:hypothetical protein